MSKKVTIASASSAEYFHFLQGMVLSVRDRPESKDIDISLYDLGLTDEQLAWLGGYVNNIVKPKWEYGLTEKSGMRDPFRAILAKPLLPKYFPGYDIYMHLDADAWVQQPAAPVQAAPPAEDLVRLSIDVSKETRKALKAWCNEHDTTIQALVRELIETHLREHAR